MKRKIICIMMLLAAFFCSGSLLAEEKTPVDSGSCGDSVTWALYEDGELVISGSGAMADHLLGGTPWYTNHRNDILSITVEEGVESIGNNVFAGCKNLTSVTIPLSVTSIGSRAFYSCNALTDVNYAGSFRLKERLEISSGNDLLGNASWTCGDPVLVDSGGGWRFYNDGWLYVYSENALQSANEYRNKYAKEIWDVTLEEGIERIRSNAFYGCSNLTNVTIPDTVTSIESQAFSGCSSLTSVILPDVLTSIAESAFSDCTSLTAIDIPAFVTSIERQTFWRCNNLASVDLPAGLTSIKSIAFQGCSSLSSIQIPNTVTNLGGSAFSGCSSLESVSVPDGITTLGNYTFSGCSSLTSVSLPDSLKWFGDGEFEGCSSLASISIPETVMDLGYGTFSGCSSLTSISIPEGITSIGQYTFEGCSNLSSVSIPNTITSVEWSAFQSCTSLTSISLPEGVTSIGKYAFRNCTSLASISIPEGITSIGQSTFEGCTSLASVLLPETLTTIGSRAFGGCENLISVVVPDTVTSIGSSPFDTDLVGNLQKVYLPASIQQLGFIKSKDIYYAGSEEEWKELNPDVSGTVHYNYNYIVRSGKLGENISWKRYADGTLVLSGSGAMTAPSAGKYYPWHLAQQRIRKVIISEGITSVSAGAFSDHRALTQVELAPSVTAIGDYAFSLCTGLEEIRAEVGTVSLGEGAFLSCTGLKTVTLPYELTQVGEDAFLACDALTDIYYGGTEEEWQSIAVQSGNEALAGAALHPEFGYEVSFVNDDGSLLQTVYTHYGKIPEYPEPMMPVSALDPSQTVFKEWTPAFSVCREDCTYKAVYEYSAYETSYEWIEEEDGWTVKAVAISREDPTDKVEETAAASVKVVIAPSCEESGFGYLTAEFSSAIFQTQIRETELQPTGHAFLHSCQWNQDHSAGTMYLVCENDEKHTEIVTAESTIQDFPGCESDGRRVYTVSVELGGKTYADSFEEPIPAVGHKYLADHWNWYYSDEVNSAKLVLVCEHNDSHTESVYTDHITTQTSYTDTEIVMTYTAEVTVDGEIYTGTQTVKKPKSDISSASVSFLDMTYTGEALEPLPYYVRYSNVGTLEEGKDFVVESYQDNVHAGKASVVIRGIGKYMGTKTVTFNIRKANQEINIEVPSTTMTVGEKQQVSCTGGIGEITYSTGDETIATVSATGEVTAIREGQTCIRVSALEDEDHYGSEKEITFNIRKADQEINIEVPSTTMTVGEKQQVSCTGGIGEITYNSGDETIATVSATGEVTALRAGQTYIRVNALEDEGHYGSEKEIVITINPIDISQASVTIPETTYTGEALEPYPTVTYDGKVLSGEGVTEHPDFRIVSYTNNVDAGTAYLTIEGTGEVYEGTIIVDFTINKAPLTLEATISSACMAVGDKQQIMASGQGDISYRSDNEGVAKVSGGGRITALSEGTAIITVVAAFDDNYEPASITIPITVTKAKIHLARADITISDQTYTGKALTPRPVVKYDGITLAEGTDYTITSYKNNVNAGTASLTITGTGEDWTGTRTVSFTIKKASGSVKATISSASMTVFDKQQITASGIGGISFKSDNTKVAEVDLDVDNHIVITALSKGSAKITITAAGDRNHASASTTLTISVAPIDLSKVNVSIQDQTFTGKALTPVPELTYKSKDDIDWRILTKDFAFTVTYQNNVHAGKATAVIKGKGDFSGTRTVKFTIKKAEQTLNVSVPSTSMVVGDKQKITCTGGVGKITYRIVMDDAYVDPEGVTEVSAAGEITAKREGKSRISVNASGDADHHAAGKLIIISVSPIDLSQATITVPEMTYTGESLRPQPTAKGNGITFVMGRDYNVTSYKNNINAGTASLTITAIKKSHYDSIVVCRGTKTVSFTIKPADISSTTIEKVKDQNYTGEAIKPTVTVKSGNTILQSGTDYTVSYKNNVDPGTATVTITGKGNYTGTATSTFRIVKEEEKPLIDVSQATVSVSSQTYTGAALKPAVTVKIGTTTLGSGTDYTVSYKNNTNVGTATVTITGKGNYTGTKTATFTIKAKSISSATVSGLKTLTYNKKAREPEPTVKDGSQTLVKGTDYTVSYKNNKNAGKATVTITGKGNYTGTKKATFTIKPKSITGVKIKGLKTLTYTGEKLKQSKLVVKDGKTKLKFKTDYKLKYKNSQATGKATITFIGTGNYTGKVKKYFNIRPAKSKIASVKNSAKGTVTLKWKIAKSGTGYEVQYGTKSSFKGAKKIDIPKRKTKTKKITGLKKGKTYYFRVRAYVTIDGEKVFGDWSAKEKLKIKK